MLWRAPPETDLQAEFSSVVVASESFWMICEHRVPGPDAVGCCGARGYGKLAGKGALCARLAALLRFAADGLLTVNLQKARKGETWAAVFKGHAQVRGAAELGPRVARMGLRAGGGSCEPALLQCVSAPAA